MCLDEQKDPGGDRVPRGPESWQETKELPIPQSFNLDQRLCQSK